MKLIKSLVPIICILKLLIPNSSFASHIFPGKQNPIIIVWDDCDTSMCANFIHPIRILFYEDGEIILKRRQNGKDALFHSILTDKEMKNVKEGINNLLSADLPLSHYSNYTYSPLDLGFTHFIIFDGAKYVTYTVFAFHWKIQGVQAFNADQIRNFLNYNNYISNGKRSNEQIAPAPEEIYSFYKMMCKYTSGNYSGWQPKYFIVNLFYHPYSPQDAMNWPDTLPNINSDQAIKISEAQYRIYIDYSRIKEAEKYLKNNKETLVRMNNKNYMAKYEIEFPGEDIAKREIEDSFNLLSKNIKIGDHCGSCMGNLKK